MTGVNSRSLGWRDCTQTRFKRHASWRKPKVAFTSWTGSALLNSNLTGENATESCDIARDGRVLVIERFDLKPDGTYLPQDTVALTMDGTKRWSDRKRLERFGVRRCQLAPAGAHAIVAEVVAAVDAVSNDLNAFSELDPGVSETASLMKPAWVHGVASLALAGS